MNCNMHHEILYTHTHNHSVLSNNAQVLLIVSSLTGACETGVAGVSSTGDSAAGTGT